MRSKCANPDVAFAQIAGRQHGIVTRQQLLGAGVGEAGVSRRVRAGRLYRVHQGVYAVGHPALSTPARWMAAVLACPGAVLSHRSAAVLWRLLEPRTEEIHVSVATTAGRRKRRGILLHRPARLGAEDVTRRRGIPVTTPTRTIADLRGAVPEGERRRAIRQAEVRGYGTGLEVAPTRSELEDLFLDLCRRQRFPAPEINVRVAGREVDFLWREHRLVAETDGYRYHRGSTAFEDDHDRDLDLRDAGFAVLRFTYRQVTADPERVARSIARELESVRGPDSAD